MAKFSCEFPGCSFSTDVRGLIERHHIIPRGQPGCTNKPKNLIYLCPHHHNCIYVPSETQGKHARVHEESIILVQRLHSNRGPVLEFIRCSDNLNYFFFKDGTIWPKESKTT